MRRRSPRDQYYDRGDEPSEGFTLLRCQLVGGAVRRRLVARVVRIIDPLPRSVPLELVGLVIEQMPDDGTVDES
ncbi:hypothetical protein C5C25_00670 [Rathayibacter sp. AY2B9]|nr:hypothetical protein C5C25_00670 [Rathayibacter sp. AY2B9]